MVQVGSINLGTLLSSSIVESELMGIEYLDHKYMQHIAWKIKIQCANYFIIIICLLWAIDIYNYLLFIINYYLFYLIIGLFNESAEHVVWDLSEPAKQKTVFYPVPLEILI